jgi:hypothetical protein
MGKQASAALILHNLIPTTPLQHAPLVGCALPVRLLDGAFWEYSGPDE